MSLGGWNVDVKVNELPEKVATAMAELNSLVGVEYEPIAYLGTQVVNGTNHAVLAEQIVLTGKDTKNVVTIIFNEKPGEIKFTLVAIERVLEQGGVDGGVSIDVETDIPVAAKAVFDVAFEGFVGSKVDPFALLGTQVTEGENYIFAAEVTPVSENPEKKVSLVAVNALTKDIAFTDILTSKYDVLTLGYAFTWLKRGTSFGAPLGEWP